MNEGETLNLTCTVDSFPPSFVTWIKHPDSDVLNGTNFDLENDTLDELQNISQSFLQKEPGRATFFSPNVTAEDSGQYICKVQHVTKTVNKKVNVKVTCKYKQHKFPTVLIISFNHVAGTDFSAEQYCEATTYLQLNLFLI